MTSDNKEGNIGKITSTEKNKIKKKNTTMVFLGFGGFLYRKRNE